MSVAQEVQPTGGAASYRGLFAQPLLRRLALADVCARLPQGMVSITLLLVAAQHASMTVGSIVGSLLLGAQSCPKGHDRKLPRLLIGYTTGLTTLTAAALGYPYLLAVAAPLAGLCLGPTLATLFGTAAGAAPPGSGTETQAWVNSIMSGGGAAGAAVAGLAAGRPVLALALAAGAAAAATLSATTSHKHG